MSRLSVVMLTLAAIVAGWIGMNGARLRFEGLAAGQSQLAHGDRGGAGPSGTGGPRVTDGKGSSKKG